jgi:peptidoglycan/LPS O-acetylase OafA/YrhL
MQVISQIYDNISYMNEKLTLLRLKELDSLRGIAAIGIAIFHYSPQFNATPISFLLSSFYIGGYYFVDFFFLLSGFVLARTYIGNNKKRNFSNLLLVRLVRLYPLHFVTLLIVLLQNIVLVNYFNSSQFIYEFNDIKHFFLNMFLVNGIGLEGGFSFNGPSWAVSTLIFANILFFFILTKLKNKQLFYILSFLIPLIVILLTTGMTIFPGMGLFATIIDFFAGVLLFLFIRRIKTNIGSPYFYDVLFIISTVIFFIYMSNGIIKINAINIIVACIIFSLILFSSINGKVIKNVLRHKILIYLGKISFAIYMIHYPVQLLFRMIESSTKNSFNYSNWWLFILFFAVVILTADISYRLIELPGKRLARKISK